MVGVHVVDDDGRQRVDVPNREVDLAADEQHDLGCTEDRWCSSVLSNRANVVRGHEVGVFESKVDDQRNADDKDTGLAPTEQRLEQDRGSTASGRCCSASAPWGSRWSRRRVGYIS